MKVKKNNNSEDDSAKLHELIHIQTTLEEISNRDGSEFIPLVDCSLNHQKISLRPKDKKRIENLKKIKKLKNVIFIPTIPSRTNSVENHHLFLKDWEYWCFELDPAKFHAGYLANWFNTKLPKEQLIRLAPSGNYMKKIGRKDIKRIYVIKHSIEQQHIHNETLNLLEKIKNNIKKIEESNSFDPREINIETIIEDIDELKILRLVTLDESLSHEYKSTLRYDLKSKQFAEHITVSALKTITAFLNSEGGNLVIGIGRDKELIGLEIEGKDMDKWQLFLNNKIRDNIGKKFLETYIKTEIKKFKDKKIAIISCKQIPKDDSASLNNEIYVRHGPLTEKLNPKDVHQWTKDRIKQ